MMEITDFKLSVLIPVYNSESTIGDLVTTVIDTLQSRVGAVEIVLVNDGSRDRSDVEARKLCKRFPGQVRYVQLARNFGEHNAVMCGLHHTTGDGVAIIDDDFQNPPGEILPLVEKLLEGYDVVYSYYEEKRHNLFRNLGSRFNNLVAAKLLRKPPGLYLSSFKVLNRFLVDTVIAYDGPYPYLDGLILRSTDSIAKVKVRHADRTQGRSNYNLRRLVGLWLNMFTGFSIGPLRLASFLGMAMSALGVLLAVFFIVSWQVGGLFSHRPIPPGWASLIVTMVFFSGAQLLVLGVVGEYIGRLFLTQTRAPQFIVRDAVGLDTDRGEQGRD